MRNIHNQLIALSIVGLVVGATPLSATSQDGAFATWEPNPTAAADGSRLTATYETQRQDPPIDSFDASLAASVTARVADRVRPLLPPSIWLDEGSTRAVLRRLDRSRVTARAVTASRSPRFVTLFPLLYEGIPLSRGSDYMAMTSADGYLVATRSRQLPTSVDATAPTVSAEEAVDAAREHAADVLAGERGSVSEPELEIWVGQELYGTLAWTFTLRSAERSTPIARRYWVRATGTASVEHWESQIHHEHFGTVTADIWQTTPLEASLETPLAAVGVNRLVGGVARIFTRSDGTYAFPPGAEEAEIQSALGGISCVSLNQGAVPMTRTGAGDTFAPIDLYFDAAGDLELAETTAYYWCEFAHTFAGLAIDVLRQLELRVNFDAFACSAFYDGSDPSLNFAQADPLCTNTASPDVVLHEYGHAVDDDAGGILDSAYSEGFSDVLANLATRQPCTARDFFGPDTCIRDATERVNWPAEGEEPHRVGQVYSGFAWDLVQRLSARMSEDEAFAVVADLVFAADAANPADIADAVRLVLLADDDDGDPSTCSPHSIEIIAAADARRIPLPGQQGTGSLDIRHALSPANDPGRFDVRLDGATVLSNAGDGAATGPLAVSPGTHIVSQIARPGTDLGQYQTFFGAHCGADGRVIVPSCEARSCTVTNIAVPPDTDCEDQCRDDRDACFADGELPRPICIEIFRICMATCN